MKKGISFVLCLILGFVLSGCIGCSGNSTVGDGKVDEVEAAVIQVAVGAAMNAMPETVVPAYAVSTAILNRIDGSEAVGVDQISAAVDRQIDRLELTPAEKQSVSELVELIRAKIRKELGLTELEETAQIVVIRTVIQIVHDAAAARLGVEGG